MDQPRVIMQADEFAETLNTLAGEIIKRHGPEADLAFIGIQRRGVHIASALQRIIRVETGRDIPLGSLDITLYRDDWTVRSAKPAVGQTRIPFDPTGKDLILVDDVLYTGRTIRAALEALEDYGRPGRIELLVMADRGHRELPIQPDICGIILKTTKNDRVDVLVEELDGEDGIKIKAAPKVG